MVSATVAANSQAIALRFAALEITYGDLDVRANGLAHRLREWGVGTDVPVCVALHRGFDMVVAILAVLKAGGAYVPLDPAWPALRLRMVLEDCQARVLLTQTTLRDRFQHTPGLKTFCLDEPGAMPVPRSDAPAIAVSPQDLAYVIYTSGSSGQPKGVAMAHGPVCNLLNWQRANLAAEQAVGLRTLQYTSLGFDVSVQEIFCTLVEGGTLQLIDEYERRDSLALLKIIIEHQVQRLFLPFVALDALCQAAMQSGMLPASLRRVMTAGEQLRVSPAMNWLFSRLQAVLHNQYGPTETCVIVSDWPLRQPASQWPTLPPIGFAIQNVGFWVMSEQGEQQPAGVPGELWVGGACLARGYLGRGALTAERFVAHPFDPRQRLYRTGDMVRQREDGALEFLGRIDQQVKLRGFRIELGEVEAVIGSHPRVREVAVLVLDSTVSQQAGSEAETPRERTLGAFVVASPGEDGTGEEIQAHSLGELLRPYLRERLPDYMLPDDFIPIDKLPRSPSGKLDRNALCEMAPLQRGLTRSGPKATTAEPADPLETQMLEIWRKVLGRQDLGVQDNIFDAGVHSLLAARLRSALQERFGGSIALRLLFEHPSVRQLVARLRNDGFPGLGSTAGALPDDVAPGELQRPAYVPMSFAQQSMWLSEHIQGRRGTYNVPLAVDLQGVLDVMALRKALTELVRRHEVLRTRLVQRDSTPVQVVDAAPADWLELEVADLDGDLEHAVDEWLLAASAQPMDLQHEGPWRQILARISDRRWVLLLTIHHSALDGWSAEILLDELSVLYVAALSGDARLAVALPPLPLQYADFALWQHRHLSGPRLQRLLDYWTGQLKDAPQRLEVPTDRTRPLRQSHQGASLDFVVSRELTEEVRLVARQESATPFMLVLTVWASLLGRYSRQDDLLVGTAVANRPHPALENLLGMFVNTLALRIKLSAGLGLRSLLAQVRSTCLEGFAHQELPFEQLVQALQVEHQAGWEPLCQVLLVWQTPVPARAETPGLQSRVRELHNGTAKYDLLLSVYERDDRLDARLEYASDLYFPETVERLATHFVRLLRAALAQPDKPLGSLPLLSLDEWDQQQSWNAVTSPYPAIAVHEVVATVARQTPMAVALRFGSKHLRYGDLDARANGLAHRLRELGVGRDVPVGVALERSLDMIVAVLAVLKAGGFYVPLDPAYPIQRLSHMLQDCTTRLVLTQSTVLGNLPDLPGLERLCLDEPGIMPAPMAEAPPVHAQPGDLIYLIYTSGSTGLSKGVAMSHGPISNLLQWQASSLADEGDAGLHTLQYTSLSFDVSAQEIFCTLMEGGTLHMIDEYERRDGHALLDFIIEQGIERLFLPFVALDGLCQAAQECGRVPTTLRRVITAGEQLRVSPAVRWLFSRLDAVLHNQYGPSETHVVSEWTLRPPAEQWPNLPPIGAALPNVSLWVLDEHLQPLPVGVPGELYLGGACLARGYWLRAELTAERFVPHPFEPGLRLYRSGDLVKRREGGELEFLGRIDQQVKLRGYRIELGEVETALALHPAISELAVVVHAGTELTNPARLIAYIVPVPHADAPDTAAVRAFLSQTLPDYMLPDDCIALASLPRTPSGKLDRRNLPAGVAWPVSNCKTAVCAVPEVAAHVPPATTLEITLLDAWCAVLGRTGLGVTDSFFQAGGHSLDAARLRARLQAELGIELTLRDIFEAPTVRALAGRLRGRTASSTHLPGISPSPRDQPLPLSPGQSGLWFIEQLHGARPQYNVLVPIRLRGTLRVDTLERVLNAIVRRHEVLRSRIHVVDERPVQWVAQEGLDEGALAVEDLRREPEPESRIKSRVIELGAHSFDLGSEAPLRLHLLRQGNQDWTLLLVIHHAVFDGWSLGLWMHEFNSLYNAFIDQSPSPLPPLPVQYADFAVWQHERLKGPLLQDQLDYWKKQLHGVEPYLELPTDHPRPASPSHRGGTLDFELDVRTTFSARNLALQEGGTLFMVLLAAWAALLSRYSGQQDFVIGSPLANRPHPDTEDLIGLFTNTVALRMDLAGQPSLRTLLARVRHTCLEAQAHQDVPFSTVVESLRFERDLSREPLVQVQFVLQNNELPVVHAPGLSGHIVDLAVGNATSKLDLLLSVTERDGGLRLCLEYALDVFTPETAERISGHFVRLLSAGLAEPDKPMQALSMMRPQEWSQQLAWSVNTVGGLQGTVHERFAMIAAERPGAIALRLGATEVSYAELNTDANGLAHRLRELGVGTDVPVGLAFGRGIDLVVAMLAVLKAGGAYVPLDPVSPIERLNHMLQDSGATLLLTESTLLDKLPSRPDLRTLCLDIPGSMPPAREEAPVVRVDPEHLAYVIYTSGSTGRPKGVAITHQSILRLALEDRAFQIGPEDVVLHFASVAFDAATLEIWGALLNGACVAVHPQGMPSTDELAEFLKAQQVSVAWLTSALFHLMVDEQPQALAGVRQLLAGGDVLSSRHVCRLLALMPPEHALINGYGPTENTTFTCCHRMQGGAVPVDHYAGGVPIGRPIAHTSVWVLDEHRQPLPVGIPGELYTGGLGLARGYWRQPDLTAKRFVPHPWVKGERLYRTGDQVRWRADGSLEFLGRKDQQVKLRGFRVELGEIEFALRKHAAVRDAAVAVHQTDQGEPRLVAYVVAESDMELPDADRMRDFLRVSLPEYMLPTTYAVMQSFPVTANGKLDRRALSLASLPEPDAPSSVLGSLLEVRLLALWQDVLGRPDLGVHDNFFASGGHSLAAANLVQRVRKVLGLTIHVAQFFTTQTVAEMARHLEMDGQRPLWSTLVPMQPEGGLNPLFLFHGYGGNVYGFVPIARELAPHQPVFGIQVMDLDEHRLPQADIEELARHYASQLQSVHSGPFRLGGFSMGGWIAWATAEELHRRGGDVELVIMLDVHGSARMPLWIHFGNVFLLVTPIRGLNWVWMRVKRYLKSYHKTEVNDDRKVAELTRSEPCPIYQAHLRYRPKSLPVKVAMLARRLSTKVPFWFWPWYAKNGFSIFQLPFRQHMDFLDPSHARLVARRISEVLNGSACDHEEQ